MRRPWILVVVLCAALAAMLLRVLAGGSDAPAEGGGGLVEPRTTTVAQPFALPPAHSEQAALTRDLLAGPGASPGQPLAPLEVSVRHADGAPAAGCRAVLVDGDTPVWSGWSDSAGRILPLDAAGATTLWIGGATSHPVRFELPAATGRHELFLPVGEVVDGRVVLIGTWPAEPLVLFLEPATDEPQPPQAVRAALRDPSPGFHAGWARNAQRLGGDGSFRFSGLARGWEGELVPPAGWSLADRPTLELTAPARGLRLELRRDARVSLRVLLPDDTPAGGARLDVVIHGRFNSQAFSLLADGDGRASFALPAPLEVHRAELTLTDASGAGRRRLALDPLDATRDTDLGDVRLEDSRTVAFRVRDLSGKPVAGARVGTAGNGRVVSQPTGEDGLGELGSVPLDATELNAWAPRHEPAVVALPSGPSSATLDIVLRACAWLSVEVTSEAVPLADLSVIVSRDVPVDDEGRSWSLGMSVGGARAAVLSEPRLDAAGRAFRRKSEVFSFNQPQPFEVGCVDAGHPITVLVREDTGHVVARAPTLELAPGEERRVTLHVAGVPRPLEVLVTDVSGAPVQRARLTIRAPDAPGDERSFIVSERHTDASGMASLEAVFAPELELECHHDDFAPVRRERVVPGVPEHIVLEAGYEVTLRCVDSGGAPLPAWLQDVERRDGTRLDLEGLPLDPPRADGSPASSAWKLEHLPGEPVVLRVEAGGREFALEHDARVPEARLELPAAGSLVVDWPLPLPAAATGQPVLVVRDDAGRELRHTLTPAQQEQKGGVTLGVVFPGQYAVRLVRREPSGAEVILLGATQVEVRAGASTGVTLD